MEANGINFQLIFEISLLAFQANMISALAPVLLADL